MDEQTLSPAELSDILGLPPSTLRTYAAHFAALLSPGARGEPDGPGRAFGHRRYTADDVALLRRAKELLEAGLSYRAARDQLAGRGPLPGQPLLAPRLPARARAPNAPTSLRQAASGAGREAPAPLPPAVVEPPAVAEPPSPRPAVPDPALAGLLERLDRLLAQVQWLEVAHDDLKVGSDELRARVADVGRQLDRVEGLLRGLAAGRAEAAAGRGWVSRLFRRGRSEP